METHIDTQEIRQEIAHLQARLRELAEISERATPEQRRALLREHSALHHRLNVLRLELPEIRQIYDRYRR